MPRGSACLGWDNLKLVTKALGGRCALSRSAAFQHQDSALANGRPAEVGSDGVLRGDLGRLSQGGALAESAVGRFDVVVCQEVLQPCLTQCTAAVTAVCLTQCAACTK